MARTWSDAELNGLIEEVLVDAYIGSEQLGAFECAFAQAALPVSAEALGLPCSLIKVDFGGDERRGPVGEIDLNGNRHRVSLLDITITDGSHDAARLMAAFRWW